MPCPIQEGDLIEEVNHHAVSTVGEFEQAMRGAAGQTVLLRVMRNGRALYRHRAELISLGKRRFLPLFFPGG